MQYIYMDESGDLGFDFSKTRTSKFFVMTFLFSENKRSLEKVIKKIFKGFSKAEIKRHKGGVLHCYKEHPRTINKMCNLILDKEVKIMTIILNKERVYTNLQEQKHILYNYVTNILLDRIFCKDLLDKNSNICFIASKRETNKYLNENFMSYLNNQILENHKLDIEIDIKTPYEDKGLQIVDFLSYCIFQKYENNKEEYYQIFQEKIVEENWLYK